MFLFCAGLSDFAADGAAADGGGLEPHFIV